jgi:mannose-1-phosphate guanylyltransferase
MRYAVILAGGGGNRLWPASRRSRPKQFLPLGARPGESLLAATSRRLAEVCPPERVVVVSAAAQTALVRAELPALGPGNLIAEPVGRNTAAALGLAAVHLAGRDADAIMGVLPADHHIADPAGFARVAQRAFTLAELHDVIVTIGIVPTRPETGFGYLQVGERFGDHAEVVSRFVEKPDASAARAYVEAGDHLWNGGMFFVRASRLLSEIGTHMPETYAGLAEIRAALRGGGADAAARAAERVYPGLPAISIDHGVMERARDVVTIRGDFGWNDVGSWSALAEYRQADERGNITEGTTVLHDAADNIVIADPGVAIAVIGVSGLVVVQSENGVVVVPRERAQEVRAAVAALQTRNLDEYL